MYRRILVFSCKILIKILRLVGKNGSALPGLVIERLDPNFLDGVLASVEKQIILVTGTNGKTTTTKMLVTALRGAGKRVVTNSTGSNMTRGLIAAVVEDMTYLGSLKPTDWFVFEMDEAYAPIFVENMSPRLLVALNVLRDQLDRYGEVDKTARLISEAAIRCDTYIYNASDPLLTRIAPDVVKRGGVARSFGAADNLLSLVHNEESTHGTRVQQGEVDYKLIKVQEDKVGQSAVITSQGDKHHIQIPVKGFHNVFNATAVFASVSDLLDQTEQRVQAMDAVASMPIPFGRGELLKIRDKNITVALVKNPAGFTSNLVTFVQQGNPKAILFVVNDRFADGRDVSWLWDVEFKNYIDKSTTIYTSGVRGNDMALRLKHDGFKALNIDQVERAITSIIKSHDKDIVVIPTYTALFEVRSALSKYGKVPRIW